MDSVLLSALSRLTNVQKTALKNGNLLSISDILSIPLVDVARKCKVSPVEAQGIINSVCREKIHRLRRLCDVKHEGDDKFTTGDAHLDDALGGGIRTGMVWEVVGESAAGKTQLALQLSLMVQMPPNLGGISGSACYLTISSKLPTSRLLELTTNHPLLSPSLCNLSEIHTIATESIPKLLHVLSKSLPEFLQERSNNPNAKPVKLIVIDALAELFHSAHKTTTTTLVERSRNISELSTLLHALASKYRIAVLVLNEVVDVFEQGPTTDTNDRSDLEYRDQAKWFNRGDSVPGENRKEASLGLVWANQVNVRIMLTRTGRRRYLDDVAGRVIKQRRVDSSSPHFPLNPLSGIQTAATQNQPTLIRRLSIVFSSICLPTSLDYIVTQEGISSIPEDISIASAAPREFSTVQYSPAVPVPIHTNLKSIEISPLDAGSVHDAISTTDITEEPGAGDDDWEEYWKEDTNLEQLYCNVDLDALLDPKIPNVAADL